MSKWTTLTENHVFRRLYNKGKSFVSPVLVTYIAKNRYNETRIGITTGKKIGMAVQRSRARRVIRAAYSAVQPQMPVGYDVVFVARSRTCRVKMQEVELAMRAHLRKAGVLQ